MNARAWFYSQSFHNHSDTPLPVESRSSVGMETICNVCGKPIVAGNFIARYIEGQPVQKLHEACA